MFCYVSKLPIIDSKCYSRAEGRHSTTTQSESASKHGQEQEMVESDGVHCVIPPAPTTTGARQGETEFSGIQTVLMGQ